MLYRTVGDRCAIDVAHISQSLSIDSPMVVDILEKTGFKKCDVDLIARARSCVGKSQYKRFAKLPEAPEKVDCSTFIQWVFIETGIELPRLSVQQFLAGTPISIDKVTAGDLVFTSGGLFSYVIDNSRGCIDRTIANPEIRIGHVGIATNEGTIIHAANKRLGVVESSFKRYVGRKPYYVSRAMTSETITVSIPHERHVISSDDIFWIVYRYLCLHQTSYLIAHVARNKKIAHKENVQ